MKLSYVVNKVTWKAEYDLQVMSNEFTAQLTYFGTIINNSGEDWDNV